MDLTVDIHGRLGYRYFTMASISDYLDHIVLNFGLVFVITIIMIVQVLIGNDIVCIHPLLSKVLYRALPVLMTSVNVLKILSSRYPCRQPL